MCDLCHALTVIPQKLGSAGIQQEGSGRQSDVSHICYKTTTVLWVSLFASGSPSMHRMHIDIIVLLVARDGWV